jgi:hypothetical protein
MEPQPSHDHLVRTAIFNNILLTVQQLPIEALTIDERVRLYQEIQKKFLPRMPD